MENLVINFVNENVQATIVKINSRPGSQRFTSTAAWAESMAKTAESRIAIAQTHKERPEKSAVLIGVEKCEDYIKGPNQKTHDPLQRLTIIARNLNIPLK